jgi:predicted 2-oxoglutarate/Fe(II)-dependent dioxygenase YbiX
MIIKEKILFSTEECETIISIAKSIDVTSSKIYFEDNNIKYNTYNINRNDNINWIFERMFEYFTKTTGIEIIKPIDILHVHNYKTGDVFKKHKDNLYPTQIHNIGVCLNDDYVGGEFVLYEPYEILPKKQGEIYTFPSLRMHEVKEILEGERWSIIAFLHIDNLDLKKTLL